MTLDSGEPSGRRVLSYATPPPARGFAGAPKWVVMLVAIVIPGLPSALIRGAAGLMTLFSLWLAAVIAFLFFGLFWGEIVFRNSPLAEAAHSDAIYR